MFSGTYGPSICPTSRRWSNVKPTLIQRLVSAGYVLAVPMLKLADWIHVNAFKMWYSYGVKKMLLSHVTILEMVF